MLPELHSTKEIIQALQKQQGSWPLPDESEWIMDYTPCDSPIEDIFYVEFQKRMRRVGVTIERQVVCPVLGKNCRLDFLITQNERKIGVECDGKEFHSETEDCIRDEWICRVHGFDRIYRISGRDLWFRTHDIMHLLLMQEPRLFSVRGQDHIEHLATPGQEYEDMYKTSRRGFPYRVKRYYRRGNRRDELYEKEEAWRWKDPAVLAWSVAMGLPAWLDPEKKTTQRKKKKRKKSPAK